MPGKLKLDIAYTPAFGVVGLFTPQKDYRLCWFLNQHLNADFRRLSGFSYLPCNQSAPAVFSVYHYDIPGLMVRYFLVSNKSLAGRLFERPKNLDYLLLISKSGTQAVAMEDIIARLRKVPVIEAAFNLDNQLGERAAGFFYDFEIYLGAALR